MYYDEDQQMGAEEQDFEPEYITQEDWYVRAGLAGRRPC
jgi:hypothetical protein